MSVNCERESVDALLLKHGVKTTIAKLVHNPKLCAKCLPILLKLLESQSSLSEQAMIAAAIFAGQPDRTQKRHAVRLLLAVLRQNANRSDHLLCLQLAKLVSSSTLNKGVLVDNVDATHVHEIGKMLLDARYALEIRRQLTFSLRKIGNADAITYLRQAAADCQTAAYSLRALERLDQPAVLAELCARALKMRGVNGKSEIEEIASKIQSKSAYQTETEKVNAWLHKRGIRHTIEELWANPRLNPGCVSHLCELLSHPLSAQMLETVARVAFDREPDTDAKRRAIDVLLERIKRHRPDQTDDEGFLSDIITGEIANHIEPQRVHEIGRLLFNTRLGDLRTSFTQVLCKIRGAEAIAYLRKGVEDPEVAPLALDRLAHMGAAGTIELCQAVLKRQDVRYKDAIKETFSRLKRRAKEREKRHRK